MQVQNCPYHTTI